MIKRHNMGVAALAFAAICAACASGGASDGDVVTSRVLDEYRLDSGDEIAVTVFGEQDLSGEFVVDGLGFVSIPLVGEIKASELTLRQFQRNLETALADGLLNNPQVSAEVLSFRPFYILGEVNRPGEYPYTSGLTIFNAVATAEGFTFRANKKVVLIREAESDEEIRVRLTPSTLVAPGDTIIIRERLF